MIYGISGAHRSGKTTLAKAVAERTGITYLDASVSKIMKENGFNAVGNMDLGKRLEAQKILLDVHREMLESQSGPVITDRTPVDFAAYMLCEVNMHSDPELGDIVHDYMVECLNLVCTHYDGLLVARPLPYYQVEEGKPSENKAYQWNLNMTIEGIMSYLSGSITFGVLSGIEFDGRVNAVTEFVNSLKSQTANSLTPAVLH